ncbi:MAG: hypothetical protein HQM13_18160 [SAR324 cluster bacterium]|nr:hypothetical protein [SAR324 cluster bacterium]
MPRILRNYLISFVAIGIFFLAAHFLDLYLKSQAAQQNASVPAGTSTPDPPKTKERLTSQ